MLQNSLPDSRAFRRAFAAVLLLCAAAAPLRAQSGDAGFPTPVFAGEVSGRISPRDVGDPRRTRHFYTFRGTEGDLTVTLETSQLIGDVDVFTATTFRPLLKFTLFGDPARLSKSFYIRKEESLVLRVEARAVGDAEGSYTIRFGGSFVPAPSELANAPERPEPTLSPAGPRGGNTRRVTATGARIDEPTPEPTPAEEAREAARPAATPTPERSSGRGGGTATSRRGRGTRNPPSRSRPGTTAARPDEDRTTATRPAEESSAGSTTEAAPAPSPTNPPRRRGSRPPRRASSRENAEARGSETAAPTPAPPPTPPPAVTAQRLVIVLKDGETLERDMGGVRRVTVENNQVVIVGKDGKVTRRPLASVLRMSIEP